ncbi:M-phase phosphoprotein 8 isoform X1 [Hippocampus comes]|uniref:M-phase phosphoprotein 8 isoform X1 n=1 Tax=Hippocampus comes TaxID=109280 RepID=UPI00094F3103|nr:PREDICTED: M-phase phosphoprotein 8 isoform X1 [Hippocampus comes]
MDSELQKMEPVDSEQDEEENVYEVERIIDMRVEEGEVLYRVRWKGYCSDDDTWEPEGHLEDCREVLLAYKKATIEIKKEPEDRKPILPLPIKSDVFDADSESDSDKDQPANDTAVIKKKKKKKKFRELEDEEEETPRKEKKKKKKKDKWRDEVKPLPAPETDEDDEEKTAETKKHVIKSENEDEAPPKKPKKEMTKDGKLRKDRGGEEPKKKKTRREYSIASSDEDLSEGLSDSSAKKEKPQLDEHRSKPKQKLDGKLKGTKDPMQDKKSKLKESSLLKLKSLTASKIREDAGPPSSDSSDSSSLHRKGKSKSQEAKAAAKPREDEAAREDGKGSTNLFETFLQSCAAKDRAPRRLPADKSASKPSKVLGKIEKIKPVKESPTLKEPERMEKSKQPEAVPRPGQGYGFSLDSDELEGENASSKPRTGDYSRERREKPEESQTRPGWEPKGPPEDRKKKREDGEPRPLAASDDHADQQPTEPTDKSVTRRRIYPEDARHSVFKTSEDELLSGGLLKNAEDALDKDDIYQHCAFSSSSDGDCEEDEEEVENNAGNGGRNEVENNGTEEVSEWLSKNKMLWAATHETATHFTPFPILTPGPTLYAIARITTPESAFNLFFNEDILAHIVKMTNLHRSSSLNWKTLTVAELRAYLGLLILAGLFKSQHLSNLWRKNPGRAMFVDTMSHWRFCQINGALRFCDTPSRQQESNKLAPIIDLWTMWNDLVPKMFNLDREICVGEMLVPCFTRCSFKEYMPSKPVSRGIKIWTVCDVATSYAWNMQVYTGKPPGGKREKQQGMRVVLELCDTLEGHTVTTDKFFTSFALAAELNKKRMALVGRIRKNKPQLPPQLLNMTDRRVFSSLFAFRAEQTLVSFIPSRGKNVLFLSTKHREPELMKEKKNMPKIIHDYNICKGAVDRLDQRCATYSCRQLGVRWAMCLFYHMLDVSCYNAFVLFTTINPEWNQTKSFKRRLFLNEVANSLILPEMEKRRRR